MADCSTFDVLVVDWLYDELDPAEVARFTRHVDGCAACWQAAESLVQVRALMRALPEEEPPAAISARVLREATAHAAIQQGHGLSRVSAWITGALGRAWAHPAAAAMASLVLVAGVAGALFARDRLEMAAPRAESTAVHRDDAPGQTAPVAGIMGGSESGGALPSPAAEAVQPSEMATDESPDDERQGRGRLSEMNAPMGEEKIAAERERRKPLATPARRADRQLERGLAAQAGDAEEQTVSLAQDMASEALLDLPGDRDGQGYADGSGGAGKQSPPQAPAAAGPRENAAAEPAGRDKSEDAQPRTTTRKASASTTTWVESRRTELRAALSDQQCTRAVGIADDIQAREPGYYRSQLASSKELATCRATVRKAANRAGKSQDGASEPDATGASKSGDSARAE
jgi:hypothetical protein